MPESVSYLSTSTLCGRSLTAYLSTSSNSINCITLISVCWLVQWRFPLSKISFRFGQSHVKLVDWQLNETIWIVSGTIRQTALQWLPVLSHIAPSLLPSDLLSSLQTSSIIYQENLLLLFTRTSSTIQCLVCHPTSQYSPSTHLLPQ